MPDFVIYPHAKLVEPAVARPVDEAMLAAAKALQDAALEVQAYGLAAAHLGLTEPVVVVSMASDADRRDYRILCNPTVVAVSEQTSVGPEGSVSLPGVQVPVERPVWAEIGYTDLEGGTNSARLEGFAARVALHEIDQMNGIFFLSRVSRIKRETALRKFEKSRRLQG